MLFVILSFVSGVWACQQLAHLFPLALLIPIWVGLSALACTLKYVGKFSFLRFVTTISLCILLGLSYATWRAQIRLADALPRAMEGQDLEVVGVIDDLPNHFEHGLRFSMNVLLAPKGVPHRILLSWYDDSYDKTQVPRPEIKAGETWRLTVRLKRAHGNLNPHGFDYEGYLLERGIRASGYIRHTPNNSRVSSASGLNHIQAWREHIRENFYRVLGDAPYAGVIVALVVGDQSAIPQEQWDVFRATGVTHLMSISGLHVTLVGALVGAFIGGIWRRLPHCVLRLPAQKIAIASGATAAACYTALAGFGVPAQRTLYMLLVVALAIWSSRIVTIRMILAWALFVVVLVDPWASLSAGFWLSFGAVAVLLYVANGRLRRSRGLSLKQKLYAWIQTQWAVTLAALPILLVLFQQFSLISPLANVFAIPLVSMLVTPLALIYVVIPWDAFLHLAHTLTTYMMQALNYLATLPYAVWQQAAPPLWLAIIALVGAIYTLLPRGIPGRFCALIPMMPLLFWQPPRPTIGHAKLVLLDVGQGLSAHIQTHSHDLLFDAGPRYSAESDSGERIIVPYLRAEGVRRLNAFVISHQDEDHAGGAQSVIDALPVVWLISSLPTGHSLLQPVKHTQYAPCQAGQHWEWDGVQFEILYPQADLYQNRPSKTNDMSCVLQVRTTQHSVLLTADIEAGGENELVSSMPKKLTSDLLIVPHHGSKTSSGLDFLHAVSAHEAWIPVGYHNRYRHPHPKVLERYSDLNLPIRRTDQAGALSIDLGNKTLLTHSERHERARYWLE